MPIQGTTIAPVIRWAGRLCAVALLLLVIASYIGFRTAPFFKGAPAETLRHGIYLLIVFGLAVGLMWDSVGAILVLGGMLLFTVLEYSAHQALPGDGYPLFWIPGFLWLISTLISEPTR